jgi:hypothetical protein
VKPKQIKLSSSPPEEEYTPALLASGRKFTCGGRRGGGAATATAAVRPEAPHPGGCASRALGFGFREADAPGFWIWELREGREIQGEAPLSTACLLFFLSFFGLGKKMRDEIKLYRMKMIVRVFLFREQEIIC